MWKRIWYNIPVNSFREVRALNNLMKLKQNKIFLFFLIIVSVFLLLRCGIYLYNSHNYGNFVKIGKIETKNKYIKNHIGNVIFVPNDNDKTIRFFVKIAGKYHFYIADLNKRKLINKKIIIDSDYLLLIGYKDNTAAFLTGNFLSESDYKNKTEVKYTKNEINNAGIILFDFSRGKITDEKVFKYGISPFNTQAYKISDKETLILTNQMYKIKDSSYLTALIYDFDKNDVIKIIQYKDEPGTSFLPCGVWDYSFNNVFYSTVFHLDRKFLKYNIKSRSFEKIDFSEVKKGKFADNSINKYLKLDDNTVLVISNTYFKKQETYFNLFEIKENKLQHIKTITPYVSTNKKKIREKISTQNIAVLSPKRILFVGGMDGAAGLTWVNKSAYILNIDDGSTVKIQNFPVKASGQYLFSNNSKVVILGGYKGSYYLRKKMTSVYLYIQKNTCKIKG